MAGSQGKRREVEVAILGGGLAGAATAASLARAGRRVRLFERRGPAHDGGGSHGDGRIVRYTYSEEIYVEMARLAFEGWAELEALSGRRLIEHCGGWECGPEGSPDIQGLVATFEAQGIPYGCLGPAESLRRFPHFRLPMGSLALYQEGGGVVRASRAIHTFWDLAREHGADLEENLGVMRVEPHGAGVTIHDEGGGETRAEALVIAAGGWTHGLLSELGLDLPQTVTREHVAYFPPSGSLDHSFRSMPTVIDYHDSKTPFYALPTIDIPGVKVGWHRAGTPVEPDDPPREDGALFESLRRYVKERLPGLAPRPAKKLLCLYANSPDHDFILDRHPVYPQIVFGCGLSGHGFKFGPVLGQILASLATDRKPPVGLETFRADRFSSP